MTPEGSPNLGICWNHNKKESDSNESLSTLRALEPYLVGMQAFTWPRSREARLDLEIARFR